VEAYKRKRKSDSSNPLRKAFEYAVQMKHMSVVKYLMKEEPNIYKMEKSDKSLWQKAAKATMETEIRDINIGTSHRSLLLQATTAGNLEFVRLLVEERKADVNEKYNANMTPLHFASQLGNLEIVKYLVVKGGDVDAQDTFGQTPLHLAVKRNNLDIVELLLEKGAPLNIASRDGVKFLIHFTSLFIFCY
jgi:hypothetical protein